METQLKTRYSDAELGEFEKIIDEKLESARRQLMFYEEQLEELNNSEEGSQSDIDDARSSIEKEKLQNLASRQEKMIQHLNNAKMRIANKVYGICRVTGKLISKKRLIAVPHATLSIEAKEMRSQ